MQKKSNHKHKHLYNTYVCFREKKKYHKTKLFPKYLFFCPFCEYSKLLHGFEDHRKLIKNIEKRGRSLFPKKSFVFVFSVMDNIKKIASKNISVHRHSQQINNHTVKNFQKRNLIKKIFFLPSILQK